MSKQLGNGFLHQFVGSPSCLDGKLIELDFLILRQMYFHAPKGRRALSSLAFFIARSCRP
jgi:hypothetical protein